MLEQRSRVCSRTFDEVANAVAAGQFFDCGSEGESPRLARSSVRTLITTSAHICLARLSLSSNASHIMLPVSWQRYTGEAPSALAIMPAQRPIGPQPMIRTLSPAATSAASQAW